MALATNPIGSTGLAVSALGLGGTSLGNMYAAVDADHAADLIRASHAAGITLFDTAPCYGVGLSEQRLGKILPSLPRDSFVLSTKVGYDLIPLGEGEDNASLFVDTPRCRTAFDFSHDGALRSIEGSLARLGLNRIDMVAIHDPDETVGIDPAADPYAHSHFAEAMDGAYRALERLRGEGVIRAIGVGMNQWRMLVDFVEAGDFDYVLVAGRYTLLQHDAAPALTEACRAKGVSIIAGGPYSSGILASGAVPGAYFNYAPASEAILAHVRRIEALCADFGLSLPAAALHFPLRHPAVSSVIPGARSIEELDGNLAAMAETVPDGFWEAMVAEGLLPRALEAALG
ncbi:aldo/keto reductase [Flavisphingomonas formosensis]|uniref:aldo/keto reductase n=1 Tax=Flavisphingomonas formosensis TaxID=861534 RepID=UPI0012FB539F|nr:aldo/keto reductase [Sphingomonas formosensis]